MLDDTSKQLPMSVPREVILDLLPLYVAGEASPQTRALVDRHLAGDDELRREADAARNAMLTGPPVPGAAMNEGLELRALRRTRSMLAWQRRLYGWGIALSIISLSGIGYIRDGRPVFHLFLRDYPSIFGGLISLAVTCWINYLIIRRRLRSTRL